MATLIDKTFSDIDFAAIETAVKEAESATDGEIAVEIASRSRDWLTERLIVAIAGAGICGVSALLLTRDDNWGVYYDITQTALWAGIGFVMSYVVMGFALKNLNRRRTVVWKRAIRQFEKLTPVRGCAGVLVFMSLQEEEAAIVADTGIASKVEPSLWQDLRNDLIASMKKGKHAEGIIRVVELTGVEMARHFPRTSDDRNELPDAPRRIE